MLESDKVIYSIGVLWNLSNEFYSEIMKKIAISNPIIQIRKYEMREKYIEFVKRCYQDDVSEEYLSKKINRLKKSNVTNMVVFVTKVDNPEYEFDEIKRKYPCKEITQIKRRIREEFSDRIEDYFYDVILHMSDDMKETNKMKEILADYEDRVIEQFVRRGYEPYIRFKNKNISQYNTNSKILEREDER